MLPGLEPLPIVDAELRAELESVGGKEMPAQIVRMFLDDSLQLSTRIQALTDAHDSDAVAKAAHRIKGGAAAVGALRVVHVAQAMESASRRGELGGIPQLLPLLQAELAALGTEF